MAGGNQKIEKTGNKLGGDVDAITKLLGLFTGQEENTTVSGGTKTQQTMLSQEALNTLMKQVMEGNSGLAAVASSQKAPGLYNSTTRQLLTNDLLARAAGEVAVKGAPTVTSATPQVTNRVIPAAVNPKTALLGTAGLLLASPAKAAAKKGLQKLLGGTGTEVPSAISSGDISAILSRGNSGIASLGNSAMADISSGNEALLSAAGYGSSLGGTVADMFSSGGSIYDTMAQLDWGTEAAQFLGATEGFQAFDAATAFSGADFAVPGVGQILQAASGDYEGAAGSFALSQIPGVGPFVAAADKLLLDGELSQTIGEAPAEIVQAGGDFLKDAGDAVSGIVDSIFGGCFITTATCKNRNLPDNCFELTELRRLRDEYVQPNYPEQVEDYYATAPAIVAAIEAREDAAALWDELYLKYIVPCAQLAEQRRYETAHAVYVRMVGVAKALAGINPEGTSDE